MLSKAVVVHAAQHHASVPKSEFETPSSACQSSTNAVEMLLNLGVSISLRIAHVAKLLQYLSTLVVRITVAWKERIAFRGDLIGNEPRMRFIFSKLRKNMRKTGAALFASGCFLRCSYLFGYPQRCQTNGVREYEARGES